MDTRRYELIQRLQKLRPYEARHRAIEQPPQYDGHAFGQRDRVTARTNGYEDADNNDPNIGK